MKTIVKISAYIIVLVLIQNMGSANDLPGPDNETRVSNIFKSDDDPILLTDYADTITGGPVYDSGDTLGNWRTANSPILVTGDIWVPEGETLTIFADTDSLVVDFATAVVFEVRPSAILKVNVISEDSLADHPVVLQDTSNAKWRGLKFYNSDASSIVYNTIIMGSQESAIFADSSDIIIKKCTIYTNGFDNSDPPVYTTWGGGIYSRHSSITVEQCFIAQNSALSGGGLCFRESSGENITVVDNIIYNNSATSSHGGGIWFDSVTMGICRLNLLLKNDADNLGGGIYLNASSLPIENNTIVFNESVGDGAGIYFNNDSQPTLINNILWFDETSLSSGLQEIGIEPGNPEPIFRHCCIQDTLIVGLDTNFTFDPWLGLVDSNASGDYTGESFHLKWRAYQPDSSDMSPCIDKGYPESDKDPDGSRADIGAFLYFHPFHLLGNIDSSLTLSLTDSLSPYYLVAPCTLSGPKILTIEPGIEIKAWYSAFAEDSVTLVDLVIESDAVLNANGASFGCNDSVDAWKGIVLNNASQSCSLQNVNIECADSTSLVVIGSAVTIINSTFQNNSGIDGGAIRSINAALKCSLSDFSNNTADRGASIYIDSSGANLVKIYESDFYKGSATADGGAIFISDIGGSLNAEIVRNVFSENIAANDGGAISCYAFTPDDKTKFTNNTFYGNLAGHYGGAVYASSNSFFDIKNSIFWNNIAFDSQSRHVYVPHDSVTYTYCDISLDIWSLDEDEESNIHDYPLFRDTLEGDFSLNQNSPCIQRGDSSSIFNDPDGTRSDMGAKYFSQGNRHLSDPINAIEHIVFDDSVIFVNDFTIHADDTLDIEPGALFNFLNSSKLIIETGGIIQCQHAIVDLADENDPGWITFTSFDTATGWGGLVFDDVTTSSLNNALFTYANSSAITLNSCETAVVIDSCRFQNNNGDPGPGAILANGGSPTITGNYFQNNSSRGNGGAVLLTGETEATICRNIFWQNDALGFGGGLACDSAGVQLEIANNTFFENRANTAGALSIKNNTPGVIQNIMWNDTAHFISELYLDGERDKVTYCDIEGGWNPDSLPNLNINPSFSDPGVGDFNLRYYSLLINAGDPYYPFDEDGSVADIGAIFYDHRLNVEAQIPGDPPDTLAFQAAKIIVNSHENLDSLLIAHYDEFAPRYTNPDTLIANIPSYFAIFAYPEDADFNLDLILSYSEHDLDLMDIVNEDSLKIIWSEIETVAWENHPDTTTTINASSNTITARQVTHLSLWSIIGEKIGSTTIDYLPADVNMSAGTWPPSATGPDVTYLVNYFRGAETSHSCLLNGFWCSADANGDCNIIGSDVTKLVNVFRGIGSIGYCPTYEPTWHDPTELPPSAPVGWPGCEVVTSAKIVPTGAGR